VTESFVNAINTGNVDKLAELMTQDHMYVDSDGTTYSGKDRMYKDWRDYFSMVPDYQIEILETYSQGNTVVLIGVAEGTFSQDGEVIPENHWKVPAAWRADVREEQVAVWQLFVNPEPMRKILERMEAT